MEKSRKKYKDLYFQELKRVKELEKQNEELKNEIFSLKEANNKQTKSN